MMLAVKHPDGLLRRQHPAAGVIFDPGQFLGYRLKVKLQHSIAVGVIDADLLCLLKRLCVKEISSLTIG
jgi:hypothetical protein